MWSVSHLSLWNVYNLCPSNTLWFKNSSNPISWIRFKSLISLVFKVANTLFSSISNVIKSSMQIRFIQKLLARGFMNEFLPMSSCWKRITRIWIPNGEILENFPKNATSPKKNLMIFYCIVVFKLKITKRKI